MSTKRRKFTPLQHRRIQAGKLIVQGFRNGEIVKILNCGLSTVKRRRKIVTEQGLDALDPRARPGRTPKLDEKQLEKLKTFLQRGACKFGCANAVWTSRRVTQLIADKFNVTLSSRQVRRVLRKIAYSPKKPVKRSKKHSAGALERWRRYKRPHMKKVA